MKFTRVSMKWVYTRIFSEASGFEKPSAIQQRGIVPLLLRGEKESEMWPAREKSKSVGLGKRPRDSREAPNFQKNLV